MISGEAVIFNVMGGIGTLVGPILGAGFFLAMREGLSRLFPWLAPTFNMPHIEEFHYLIPLGIIFILMVIFLPQGLLGFAKRWLNSS